MNAAPVSAREVVEQFGTVPLVQSFAVVEHLPGGRRVEYVIPVDPASLVECDACQ